MTLRKYFSILISSGICVAGALWYDRQSPVIRGEDTAACMSSVFEHKAALVKMESGKEPINILATSSVETNVITTTNFYCEITFQPLDNSPFGSEWEPNGPIVFDSNNWNIPQYFIVSASYGGDEWSYTNGGWNVMANWVSNCTVSVVLDSNLTQAVSMGGVSQGTLLSVSPSGAYYPYTVDIQTFAVVMSQPPNDPAYISGVTTITNTTTNYVEGAYLTDFVRWHDIYETVLCGSRNLMFGTDDIKWYSGDDIDSLSGTIASRDISFVGVPVIWANPYTDGVTNGMQWTVNTDTNWSPSTLPFVTLDSVISNSTLNHSFAMNQYPTNTQGNVEYVPSVWLSYFEDYTPTIDITDAQVYGLWGGYGSWWIANTLSSNTVWRYQNTEYSATNFNKLIKTVKLDDAKKVLSAMRTTIAFLPYADALFQMTNTYSVTTEQTLEQAEGTATTWSEYLGLYSITNTTIATNTVLSAGLAYQTAYGYRMEGATVGEMHRDYVDPLMTDYTLPYNSPSYSYGDTSFGQGKVDWYNASLVYPHLVAITNGLISRIRAYAVVSAPVGVAIYGYLSSSTSTNWGDSEGTYSLSRSCVVTPDTTTPQTFKDDTLGTCLLGSYLGVPDGYTIDGSRHDTISGNKQVIVRINKIIDVSNPTEIPTFDLITTLGTLGTTFAQSTSKTVTTVEEATGVHGWEFLEGEDREYYDDWTYTGEYTTTDYQTSKAIEVLGFVVVVDWRFNTLGTGDYTPEIYTPEWVTNTNGFIR